LCVKVKNGNTQFILSLEKVQESDTFYVIFQLLRCPNWLNLHRNSANKRNQS
jgi:hypothetical protein